MFGRHGSIALYFWQQILKWVDKLVNIGLPLGPDVINLCVLDQAKTECLKNSLLLIHCSSKNISCQILERRSMAP